MLPKKFLVSYSILFSCCIYSCDTIQSKNSSQSQSKEKQEEHLINPEGTTIKTRFNIPNGFQRTDADENSFGAYLRNLPLKPDGAEVLLYDGSTKGHHIHEAVIDMDIGKKDLQQCADAVMRLRGEYLFEQKQYDNIHFNFTNGFRVDYTKWIEGNRIVVDGNKTYWSRKSEPSNTYADFRKYMEMIFSYAGTLSLSKELVPVTIEELTIGDVFIQGGSPGHAVIVVDVAENESTKEKIFLLAQSYMPAQETHVLMNLNDAELSPWYKTSFGEKLETPEWTFSSSDLKRFSE